MSILQHTASQVPTREIKLQTKVSAIKDFSRHAYEVISNIQKNGINILWRDNEFTPQEIIDELGQDALKIFQYHGALTQYLIGLAQAEGIQPNIILPSNAFTVDQQNGTITVSEDPYIP